MSRIRLGVIGAGGKGRQHMQFLGEFPEVEFAAICDPSKEQRDITAREFKVGSRFDSMEEMLGSVELDAVTVATPPQLNAPAAKACLERGIHTLLEKPPGLTVAETRDLRDTAARTGAKGMVGLNRRYNNVIVAAQNMVRERGPIVQLVGEFHKSIVRLEERYHDRPEIMDNWIVCNDIHAIDIVRSMAGADVREVHSFARRAGSRYRNVHAALVIFENDCVAQLSFNYTTDARLERYEIHGREISAYLEGIRGGTIMADGERRELSCEGDAIHAKDEFFLGCIRDDRPVGLPGANLDEAVKTMELAEAILAGLRD